MNKKDCGADAITVAQQLLGCIIECDGISGMIVETEAYKRDPASHAYNLTPRSEIMLRTHGTWYVYLIYGMYHCLNITTNKGDVGAVLIRALEPIKGIDVMKARRKQSKIKLLTNGPGKLCDALGVTRAHNDTPINTHLKLRSYKTINARNIVTSTRIGIRAGKDLPWRFYIKDNPFVSKK